MALSEFEPGCVIRMTGLFYNTSSALADPTTVTLYIEDANGTETALTPLVNSATGTYYYDHTLAEDAAQGTWAYRFRGTGAIIAAVEEQFKVAYSRICDN